MITDNPFIFRSNNDEYVKYKNTEGLSNDTDSTNNTDLTDYDSLLHHNDTYDSLIDASFRDTDTTVIVYTVFIIGCIIFTVIRYFRSSYTVQIYTIDVLSVCHRSLLFFWMCIRASINLHDTMFSNILQATMRFFDTNPSGRILNRFSKDMGSVDELLPRMFVEAVQVYHLD